MHSNLRIPCKLSSLLGSEIRSLIQQGHLVEALQLYSTSLLNVSRFTYPSLLKLCASLSNLHCGKAVHSTIVTTGLHPEHYIAASLMNMYVKCGTFKDALHVFDKLPSRGVALLDVAIWNSIIDGYFRYGYLKEGVLQFHRMQSLGVRPDAFSLCILLSEGSGLLGYNELKQLHGHVLRHMLNCDRFIEITLIDAYFSCYRPRDALCVFKDLKDESNVVVWNLMIGGFVLNGLWGNSLKSYLFAKTANVKLVSASFSSTFVIFGKQVHCDVIKAGFENYPYVSTSLLTMYAKSQLIEQAESVFSNIPDKSIELWNAMISGYFGNGYPCDALKSINKMGSYGILPDSFTISNILSSVSAIEAYDFGRLVHTELVK